MKRISRLVSKQIYSPIRLEHSKRKREVNRIPYKVESLVSPKSLLKHEVTSKIRLMTMMENICLVP